MTIETTIQGKIMKFVIQILESSIPMIPLVIGLLLGLKPCLPPFIWSMISNCDAKDESWLMILLRLCIVGFEVWMWYHASYAGTIWLIFIFMLGPFCLQRYIQILKG